MAYSYEEYARMKELEAELQRVLKWQRQCGEVARSLRKYGTSNGGDDVSGYLTKALKQIDRVGGWEGEDARACVSAMVRICNEAEAQCNQVYYSITRDLYEQAQRQVEELKGRLQQLGQVVDRMKGTTIAPAVAQQVQTDSPTPQEQPEQQDTQSKQAAETAAGQATPK